MSSPNASFRVHRVVIAIFDSLRPDMVCPELTPNLLRLAARGTWFREARSVFPSVTRVATTSVATGMNPVHHGMVGNLFLLPEVSSDRTFDSRHRAEVLRAESLLTDGRLVTAPTLGDHLAAGGRRLAIVHTGTAGAAHLLNPRVHLHPGHWTFSIHGRSATGTPEAVDEAERRFGPLPPPRPKEPRLEDQAYATDVLVQHVLPDLAPDVALIWYSEPDVAYHYRGIGSDEARATLRHTDTQFGRVLDWLDEQPDAGTTAIIAASDHGQITTTEQVALNDLLTRAGFQAREGVLDGAILATTGGNSGEIRVRDRSDRTTLRRVAAWLQEQPFTGLLFTQGRNEVEGHLPGTLAFGLVGLNHARAPDLYYTLRDDDAPDAYGLPGRGLFTDMVSVGGGMHGGLNRHELNTVLIIAAPGMEVRSFDAHAGIIDIAPTVLGLLGLGGTAPAVGRDLTKTSECPEAVVETFEAGQGAYGQAVTVVADAGSSERRFILHGTRIA